jgi:23S rRNA pseudouridine1911/1915/1917 synthase
VSLAHSKKYGRAPAAYFIFKNLCYNILMIITGKKFSKPSLSRVINGDVVISGDEKVEKFRLDKMLVEAHPEYNRSTLQTFIKSGYVEVDGKKVVKPNALLEKEAKITLNLPEELVNDDIKQAAIDKMRPETIFEDENVLVLNKPSGLLSMAKGEYTAEPTLEDYGLLVHRLDRDTSGVVILGKNEEAQKMLRKQFQDRKAHKTYYAIVEGRPKLDEAMIDLPMSRNIKHPTTFIVDANGKPAQTYYKVIKSNDKYSLLELRPTTGRTHQLRVHLKYLGTPILGDRVYGSAPADTDMRLYLHAKTLEITIPGEKENVRKIFEAPLPKEFNDVL